MIYVRNPRSKNGLLLIRTEKRFQRQMSIFQKKNIHDFKYMTHIVSKSSTYKYDNGSKSFVVNCFPYFETMTIFGFFEYRTEILCVIT